MKMSRLDQGGSQRGPMGNSTAFLDDSEGAIGSVPGESRKKYWRGLKKLVAGLTSFFLMLGGMFFGLDFALSTAQGAPAGPTGDPANSSWVMTPNGPLTVGRGASSTYNASITIRDEFNDAVPGEVVRIDSVPSGVTFPAGSTCTTDAAGECSVDVYSTVSGVFDFTAWLGVDQIGASESRQWTPGAVCMAASGCTPEPGVDAEHTTRVAVTTNGVVADGVAQDIATAYAYDTFGNPVPGVDVTTSTSDGDLNIDYVSGATGPSGIALLGYTSAMDGVHYADVTIDGQTPVGSPVALAFASGLSDPSASTLSGGPAGPLPVGAIYRITAHVIDRNSNPVHGAFVTFGIPGGVYAYDSTCITDLSGTCDIAVTSLVAGSYQIDAELPTGVLLSPPVTVDFVAGIADRAESTLSVSPSGPIQVGQSYTLTANVNDAYGNPVSGAPVVLPRIPGNVAVSDYTCRTDVFGKCSITVTSTIPGSYQILAELPFPAMTFSNSPVMLEFLVGPVCTAGAGCTPEPGVDHANTTRVEVITNNSDANGKHRDFVKVYAFDKYGNPVPNAPVESTSADGDLVIQPGPIETDFFGAETIWYTSFVAGNHVASVTVDGQIPDNGVDATGTVTLNFVDVTAPSAPTIDSPATGALTNARPLTVDGTAEAGSTVEVVDQTIGTTVCTATANAAGQWTCQVDLSDGDHTLTASATDAAGNRSLDSGAVDVKVDTRPPSAPRVDIANGTEVSGAAGAGEPGSMIEVVWPDGSMNTAMVWPDGSWSILTSLGMSSGEITVTATDLAGNKSGEVKGNLVTRGPSAPVLHPSDGTSITGWAEPGSMITITDRGGNPVVCGEGVVLAGADGGFRCTLVTPLPPYTSVIVFATDLAGNESPAEEVVITLLGISADFGVRESGQSLVVVGTGFVPGETVSLDFCSTCSCVGTGIADADGKVVITFEIPEGAHPGSHILRLTGDQSGPYLGSVEMTFEVAAKVDTDTPVKVDTGGYATASSGSVDIRAGVSGLAVAILLLGLALKIIAPTPARAEGVQL